MMPLFVRALSNTAIVLPNGYIQLNFNPEKEEGRAQPLFAMPMALTNFGYHQFTSKPTEGLIDMCGRYVLEGPVSRYQQHFNAALKDNFSEFSAGRFNIAPTMQIPVVRINREGDRVLTPHRWGLIPSWAKDGSIGAKLNNARGETVHEKPSFRTAFKRFRCLIPASGYYEWQAPPEGSKARKQPFYISPTNAPFFAMAGICDHWTDITTGELIMSAAIITTTPSSALAHIHDRMPVMISSENWEQWLDPKNQNIEALRGRIQSAKDVQAWPVSLAVSGAGKNREDSSKLIVPVENQKQGKPPANPC